jgi:hypothetical protein
MKIKFLTLSLAIFFASTVTLAQNSNSSMIPTPDQTVSFRNPNMGTWKLNEAKSRFGAGAGKNHTVVYEAAGDMVKVIVDGTDASGNATHNEWTGNFDGKYYAVTGDANSDMRKYRNINARTLAITGMKGARVTLTGRITVSRDGRTRTVATTTTNANGRKTKATAVYDKQ